MSHAELRDQVALDLETLCASTGPLHTDAAGASWRLHAAAGTNPYDVRYSPGRVRVHREIIDTFLGSASIAAEGSVVVATAGAPAAGKSTRLEELGYGEGWRRIDADTFKTMLIEHDLRADALAVPEGVAEILLTDGQPVMPLELAGLYHHESTVLADKAQEICLAAHENVIIEGTLTWDELPLRIVSDLLTYGYERLEVVLVETPLATALERARQRWWIDRQAGELGGRFVPASTIRSLYRTSTTTVSGLNARGLVKRARAAKLDARLEV